MHLTTASAHSLDDIRVITRIYFYGFFLKAIRDESRYQASVAKQTPRINLMQGPFNVPAFWNSSKSPDWRLLYLRPIRGARSQL